MRIRIDAGTAGHPVGILCLTVVLATNCGGVGDGVTISNQVLSGRIGGQSWSLGTATATWNAFSAYSNEYDISMYSSAFTACDALATPTDGNGVILGLPMAIGDYKISGPGSPTWQSSTSGSGGTTGTTPPVIANFRVAGSSEEMYAIEGRIVIRSVTATVIAGGANITYDTDNNLDGQFQATICP